MAEILTSDERRRRLTEELHFIDRDHTYFGGRIYGQYRYHGLGNRMTEFPGIGKLPERMTGVDLVNAIRGEIVAVMLAENIIRRACGLHEHAVSEEDMSLAKAYGAWKTEEPDAGISPTIL